MCGIVGALDLKAGRSIDQNLHLRVRDDLTHRGPGGEGVCIEPGTDLPKLPRVLPWRKSSLVF